jgi:N-acetylglucosamine malate deacetylase 1
MIQFENKKILVVVAHPDDELLGLGGTINYLVQKCSAHIKVVILGEGITSRSDTRNPDLWEKQLEQHKKNIYDAKNILGYQELSCYDFPDNRFDNIDLLEIIKVIEKEKNSFQPEIIFTHHGGDLNIDHQRTFQAVMTSSRPFQEDKLTTIVTFETPSSTEWQSSIDPRSFRPNFYVPLLKTHIENKSLAMECYQYEKRPFPHPRSPKALMVLAQNRGLAIGEKYAEAFCIVRMKLN